MYSDRVDNRLAVTIKTCNRLKGKEGYPTSFRQFIEDSGFILDYKYIKQGLMFTYILNDFEDLRSMIPTDKSNLKFKASLIIYTYNVT